MNKPPPKQEFEKPTSLSQALARTRTVTINIMNVEKQLGDRRRERTMREADYETWREKTKAARIFMVSELRFLKDWIKDRRRQLDAQKVGIWPHNDPRAILQHLVIEGRKALRGEENELAAVLDQADLFLTHDA